MLYYGLCDAEDTNEKIIKHRLPNMETVEIYPVCDMHIGDRNTDLTKIKHFLTYVQKNPNAYLVYNGDNMNNALKSSVSNVYHETMNPHEQKKFVVDLLMPVRDKFLCFVPGNHENRTSKESDVELVWDIADKLGKADVYRRNIAFLDLSFGKAKGHEGNGKNIHYRIVVMHGSGGGKKVGSMINNLEDFLYSINGCDIGICGHTHKRASSKPGKLYFPTNQTGTKMQQADFLTYVAAPWQAWGGYAARGMFRPSTRGAAPIYLAADKKRFWTEV